MSHSEDQIILKKTDIMKTNTTSSINDSLRMSSMSGPINLESEEDTFKAPVKKTRGKVTSKKSQKTLVEEGMPSVFSIGQDFLNDMVTEEGTEEVVKDSLETKDIKNKIEMIQAFLNNPMPPLAVKPADEVRYAQELESVKLAVAMMYNKLHIAMDNWVNAENLEDYTPERFELITSLREKIADEEALFAESMTEYRAHMTGSKLAKSGVEQTWADMLRYQRSEKIDLDDKKNKFEMTGGATSVVFKIERDGKTFYFKEEEKLFTGDVYAIAETKAAETSLDPVISVNFRKILKNSFEDDELETKKFLARCHEAFKYSASPWVKLTMAEDCQLKDYVLGLKNNKKQRAAFSKFYLEFYKTYLQQTIATKHADIEEGSNLSRRNVATSRLASLMGIGDMICESRTAVVKHKGALMRGNLMEEAKGLDSVDIETLGKVRYSKRAEDQLMILPIFDLLCGQVDRHFGNFILNYNQSVFSASTVTGIKCIDNDMSFGLMSYEKAVKGINQLRPLNPLLLATLPKKFRDTIKAMDTEYLKIMLMDVLSPEEINALGARFEKLKKKLEVEEAGMLDKIDTFKSFTPAQKALIKKDDECRKVIYLVSLYDNNTNPDTFLKDIATKTNFNPGLFYHRYELVERLTKRVESLGGGPVNPK